MHHIVTGWVPDRPDRNDYTLENLVKAGELRIIESIESRENDLIGLLDQVINRLSEDAGNSAAFSKNYQFKNLREKLSKHYDSTVILQSAYRYPEQTDQQPKVTVTTLPYDYLKTFYQLTFFHSRQQLTVLSKNSQSEFQKVVETFYPLIEIATILAAPINRFNSRRKNILFLVQNLFLPLALATTQNLYRGNEPKNQLLSSWEKVSQRSDFRDRYLEFRAFALVNYSNHRGDDGVAMSNLCSKVWQTVCHCYQAVQNLEIGQASIKGNLKQDIIQFIKNSFHFFDLPTEPTFSRTGKQLNDDNEPKTGEQLGEDEKPTFEHCLETALQTPQPPDLSAGCLSQGQLFRLPKAEDQQQQAQKVAGQICISIPILRSQIPSSGTESVLRLPSSVDLTPWCSPIEDQGNLQACSSHAAVSLVEYFQKRSAQGYYEASRLFLYKVTRDLMQVSGNVGTSLRETMKAMVLFGTPPEKYWPYDETKLDTHPDAFCFAYAQNYQALKYFRLDPLGRTDKLALLFQIKALLAAGFPCAFGFTLYRSAYLESFKDGNIPLPCEDDLDEGGHAVVAVGYADDHVVLNADGEPSISTNFDLPLAPPKDSQTADPENPDPFAKGALLIRNCWGTEWGDHGYGWLPYAYIKEGLTADWWSLVKAEWLNTAQFGFGCNLNLGHNDITLPDGH